MSPIAWAVRPLKKYADFKGRAARAEFWWFFLFMMIIYVVLWVVMIGTAGGIVAAGVEPSSGALGAIGAAGIFMVLFWLALLIPTIAVQVRRLHDTNRSGWWVGGFYLLYVLYMVVSVGTVLSMGEGAEPTEGQLAVLVGTGVLALAMFAYGVMLLVFYCLPGTRGANRFGEDPYGADVEQVFA